MDRDELAEALDKHTGQLTREMLEELLGCSNFESTKALKLCGKDLRHCGHVFENRDLLKLEELDLSNNFLSSIKPLRFLKQLQKLHLQNNNLQDGPLMEEDIETPAVLMTSSMSEEQKINSYCSRDQMDTCLTSIPLMTSPDLEFGLPSVNVLQLDQNSISSMATLNFLECFPRLKMLSLRSNRIEKVPTLA